MITLMPSTCFLLIICLFFLFSTVSKTISNFKEIILSSFDRHSKNDLVLDLFKASSNETAKIMHGNMACFSIKKGKIRKQMDPFEVVKILKTLNYKDLKVYKLSYLISEKRD